MKPFIITKDTKLEEVLRFLYKEIKKMTSTMKNKSDKRFWKKNSNTLKRMAIKIEAKDE